MLVASNEELAWAAGFFDGEGTTSGAYDTRRSGGYQMRMSVEQAGEDAVCLLSRFQCAIGLGNITGPRWKKNGVKPQYRVAIHGIRRSLLTASVLWPYLSKPKREQFFEQLLKNLHNASVRKRGFYAIK